jgi:hypothetical protein
MNRSEDVYYCFCFFFFFSKYESKRGCIIVFAFSSSFPSMNRSEALTRMFSIIVFAFFSFRCCCDCGIFFFFVFFFVLFFCSVFNQSVFIFSHAIDRLRNRSKRRSCSRMSASTTRRAKSFTTTRTRFRSC